MCDDKSHTSHSNNGQAFINGALLGAVAGAVLGVLFAPAPGKNTRKKLAANKEEYLDKAERILEEVQPLLDEAKFKTTRYASQLETTLVPLLEELSVASEPLKEEFIEKVSTLSDELRDKARKEVKRKKKLFANLK